MSARKVRTTCPYCGVGCGLVVEVDRDGGVRVAGDPDHPANRGRICVKGATLPETLPGPRLTTPLYRGAPVSWDEALDLIAEELAGVLRRHGPEAVAFYLSGQLLIEDYYVFNKLAKGFLGTPHVDTNSRLCMAAAVVAHQRAFGEDLVPGCYEDLELADLVVLWGSNLAACHPVLFQRIEDARAARDGRPRLVVIDPRRSESAARADLHLPLAPGTDAWLAAGLLAFLQREDRVDWEFVAAHTEGFLETLALARRHAGSIPAVARATGLPEAAIERFYRDFARTSRTVTVFSQGINQTVQGSERAGLLLDLHLATGRIGQPGASCFSVTGQPDAMGGREVGALATMLASHLPWDDEAARRALAGFWRTDRLARGPGLRAVELFEAVRRGDVRFLWIAATNPLVSLPDRRLVEEALAACPFWVVADITPESETARRAPLVLPAAGWGEKEGTVTNSERRLSRQRAFRTPPGEARPDWWMAVQLARRLGFEAAFPYEHPFEIFREHAASTRLAVRFGRRLDLGPLAAMEREAFEAMAPVQWPIAVDGSGTARLFEDGRFAHADGRARLVPVQPRGPHAATEPARPLRLLTGRTASHWHTLTRTGRAPSLATQEPEPFVAVHPDDAALLGLEDGALAELRGREGRMLARVRCTPDQRLGTVFVPMHWNEAFARHGSVNALVPAVTDPRSGEPEFKAAAVALAPFRAGWSAFYLGRRPLDFGGAYEARSRTAFGWRIEAAGGAPPTHDWRAWLAAWFDPAWTWLELADPHAGVQRVAVLRGHRLEAVLFAARHHRLPPRDWLLARFDQPWDDPRLRRALLAGVPPVGEDVDPLLCLCAGVRESRVRAALAAGALSLAALVRETGAGAGCGSCRETLTRLLAEARSGGTAAATAALSPGETL